MNEPDASLPPWLHDIFLGYGDPGAAHYLAMEGKTPTVDFMVHRSLWHPGRALDGGGQRQFMTMRLEHRKRLGLRQQLSG